MNYYRFHIGDYAAHARHLTLAEDAVYRRLLDAYYLRERPLPADPDVVARLIGVPETHPVFENNPAGYVGLFGFSVAALLEEFFTLENDGWHCKRADSELSSYRSKAASARLNGALGGRPPGSKKPKITQPVPTRVETQPKANQEPITNNQEYISPPTPPSGGRSGFSPPSVEEVALKMAEKGYPPSEAEKFWHFYESKGWLVGKARMKSWPSAVSGWLSRNAAYGARQCALEPSQGERIAAEDWVQ